MDKLILGVRIIDMISSTVLASFEGPNWFRDFQLIYNTYYKDTTDIKWDIQVLRKVTNSWLNDNSILQKV